MSTAPVNPRPTPAARCLQGVRDAAPQTHLLSNGRYHVMLTAAGSGYSRWRDLAITRWREDFTRDDWGSYFFLRDIGSGAVWSAGFQPCGIEPDRYAVTFTEARARYERTDGTLATALDVVVAPDEDTEGRRLSITNLGDRERELEVTSYCELVLAHPAADSGHPAFLKLFVQTEQPAGSNTILATRRRRSPDEPLLWAAHHAVVEGGPAEQPEFETDRARFLGRCREVRSAAALADANRLSNSTGTVLDPIFALRTRLRIGAGATRRVTFWTGIAASRSSVLELADRHRDVDAFERVATAAETRGAERLQDLGTDADEAIVFQRLAGHLLYASAGMRASADTIRAGIGTPAGLWAQGISGDVPILLLEVDAPEHTTAARQLLQCREYWRSRGLGADLVILNAAAAPRVEEVQAALETELRQQSSRARAVEGVRGAVFLLRADKVSEQTRALLPAVARVVIVARCGSVSEQLERCTASGSASAAAPDAPSEAVPSGLSQRHPARESIADDGQQGSPPSRVSFPAREDLEFFNGWGGFAADGREYVTLLGPGQATPAPWINVITNPNFGFHVSAEGGGFTWSRNSREHQLTPWSNDPVIDRPGEVLYVRDEESGALWSATAAPIRDPAATYKTRHGQGYSRFEHSAGGLALDLLVYVPLHDPVKICRLKIRNDSHRMRTLAVTAYAEWVLGTARAATAPFILTDLDPDTRALFARNAWDTAFGSRVAFADLAGRQTQWTTDRSEFLGRYGSLERPAALARARAPLSGRVGAGLDPCCALQTAWLLQPDEEVETVFFLGEADDTGAARALVRQYRHIDLEAVVREIIEHWDSVLGTVQVQTPERSMDIILNRWMLYQALACRIWARTAFYQASGAYGFRDQLQDSMAMVVTRPDLTREHLLRAAGRQFIEGDLQHWWLVPAGQGVRTRIADDTVWLAYCAHHYIEATGDLAVLDEVIPFLEGRALEASEHDAFFQPETSQERATLFEHCARALDHSLRVGEHGLPLFGTGDWNDGMNRVGEAGRGESVWLGWFLRTTLTAFAPMAAARGDRDRETRWLAHAAALCKALELAWDGEWYRRGYFDDGTPLGSATSAECRIDSIAQSWSVISGAADPARARRAMASVTRQLVHRDTRLALLFAPPFDRIPLDPGYIKGYPPGIRENGGQYTHAATWSVIAQALLGDGDEAAGLFGLLNPINHARTDADVQRYKVEPYVVAADIYSVAPNVGRGGWTWYTGSAGWMYRAGLEWILGFRLRAGRVLLDPCIPKTWPRFEIAFRYRSARYQILVENPHGVSKGVAHVELDGKPLARAAHGVELADDGVPHTIRVILGGP